MSGMATPRTQINKTGLALLAALVLALTGLPAAAHATGTLDQQQTEISAGVAFAILSGPSGTQSVAQTFTAGISGGLDQVDVGVFEIFATSPLSVEIRTVDGAGAPTATVLTSAVVPASTVPSVPNGPVFVAVPFALPAPVVAGTQYAIVIYSADPVGYAWSSTGSSIGDVYAGGKAWVAQGSPPTTSWSPTSEDLGFKTYVTASSIAPTSKSQCKEGGWRSYSQFKNQGQCVSFVQHQRT
jgi:hypothetical protein